MDETRSSDAVHAAESESRTKSERSSIARPAPSKGLSKAEFDRIYSTGLKESGKLARILFASGEGKVGFATPKKVGCHARRNRLKRQMREAVRTTVKSELLPFSMVVSATTAAVSASYEELSSEIFQLIRRAQARWAEELGSP